jgi:hypothetical protein
MIAIPVCGPEVLCSGSDSHFKRQRDGVSGMEEHIVPHRIAHRRISRSRPRRQAAEAIGRRLVDVVVYAMGCRIGDKVSLDDLAETSEVGDWKMPDFKIACTYAASQGWLVIDGDALMLTTAGSAAA